MSRDFADYRTFTFPTIVCFWILDFNGFWRENDVIRLTVKINFQLMPQQVSNFERLLREERKCQNVFENLIWLRRHDILKIAKFLKIVPKWRKIRNSQLNNFSMNKAIQIFFSHLSSSLWALLKVNLMTLSSRQIPLK